MQNERPSVLAEGCTSAIILSSGACLCRGARKWAGGCFFEVGTMLAGIELSTKQWDWDYFLSERKKVLDLWPTGRELKSQNALDAAVAYHRGQRWYKYAALRNKQALKENRIQIVPQVGHALIDQTIDHIAFSEDLAPDRWYILTDTYTRKSEYKKAQDAVDRSLKDGFSYLNGYPVVAHGVRGARALNESTKAAIGSDNNDEDARLPWEIALAGGWTWGTIKSIEQLIQHSRSYPADLNIHNQQYIDRLAAYYTEQGIPILRRANANLPGWDSLGFKVSVSLIETLLSAAQGVKYIDLSLGIGMNLVQDVSAIQVLRKLAREYLDRFGWSDVEIFSWTYFFLGDWPLERGQMVAQLAWNASVSALAGCNGMFIKSPDEATSTPTAAGFREGILICGQIARLVAGQRIAESQELGLEKQMMEAEVRAVVEKVLEIGDGDFAVGGARAILSGVLDTMFSPYKYLKGKVKVVRDVSGALRYLDHGDMPLPKEVVEYHREKIRDRERKEDSAAGVNWLIREATWASRPLLDEVAERTY
jgi:methylaspartate mutase epsilon subunit